MGVQNCQGREASLNYINKIYSYFSKKIIWCAFVLKLLYYCDISSNLC